jgi:hypothetical protein
MRAAWPGIVVAPLLALADQSVAYSLVERSCARQDLTTMHLVHFAFLVAALVTVAMAVAQHRALRPHAREDAGDPATNHSGLALVGILVAALSAFIILALWAPQWILSPCNG